MYKKSAILLTALIMSGCVGERNRTDDPWARTGGDWANDCDTHYSETSRDYAACKSRMATKKMSKSQHALTGRPVTHTEEGSSVARFEGVKEFENDDNNLTE